MDVPSLFNALQNHAFGESRYEELTSDNNEVMRSSASTLPFRQNVRDFSLLPAIFQMPILSIQLAIHCFFVLKRLHYLNN
eukprot:scaffold6000_cov103-Skeletonema_dohrnii-CCMP3373.AAC.2